MKKLHDGNLVAYWKSLDPKVCCEGGELEQWGNLIHAAKAALHPWGFSQTGILEGKRADQKSLTAMGPTDLRP